MVRTSNETVPEARRLRAAEQDGRDVAAIQAKIMGLNRLCQQSERGDFLTPS